MWKPKDFVYTILLGQQSEKTKFSDFLCGLGDTTLYYTTVDSENVIKLKKKLQFVTKKHN